MKKITAFLVRLLALSILAAPLAVWAAPTVTDITAKQRYPWNGLVDVSCKVSGIEAETGGYEFAVVAVDKETGKEYTVSNFSIQHNGEEVPDVCANGDYSLLWNAREDMGQVVFERMTVRITLEALAVSVGKVQLWEGGPYWADRNIGAKKPEDSGLYFWWGDTIGHRPTGGMFSFSFVEYSCPTYGKSQDQLFSEGWIVSKYNYNLVPNHDAAHEKWGGRWRMPRYFGEMKDLVDRCDWTWTTMNGVKGYVVRGRGDYASNSIFLPASGKGDQTLLNNAGSLGYYRLSEQSSYYPHYPICLVFGSDSYRTGLYDRCNGFSVRPVQ